MARMPKPWYRKDRKCWFVTIAGARHNLGPDRASAFRMFHELMAAEKQANKQPKNKRTVAEVLDSFLDWCQQHREKRANEWALHEYWAIKCLHPRESRQMRIVPLSRGLEMVVSTVLLAGNSRTTAP